MDLCDCDRGDYGAIEVIGYVHGMIVFFLFYVLALLLSFCLAVGLLLFYLFIY